MVVSMDITFLGTSSAQPSTTRNHQSMALRVNGDIWLFDCGEATQHQFQKSHLKMGRITKIFITHMHGDHCFGLGPLLCSMSDNLNPTSQATIDDHPPIDIYGPSRLRKWLRTTLWMTYSNLGKRYRVHELLHSDINEEEGSEENENIKYHPQELPGKNIKLSPSAVIDLGDGFKVTATGIQHSIPSLGFIIQEPDVLGNLNKSKLLPLLEENALALKNQGIKQPLSLLGKLQKTQQPIQLPNGAWLEPPSKKPGRQIVILGDTCDPSSLIPYCQAPHLLVHEATNALTSLDLVPSSKSKSKSNNQQEKEEEEVLTEEMVETRAIQHGHSTPQMAGAFAKKINARTLILTHFSSRYKGDDSEEATQVMEEIRQLAIKTFGKEKDNEIYCAKDLWFYNIQL
ncbi:beta-lactamase-like protein [Cunninghamella echinulata]|nr:beta-lactamase-like protein [Cunninghamella echinulata]